MKLEVIQVAHPCTQDWGKMRGDAQVRFCGVCRKNVYDLSEMPRAEAEAMITERETVCVRFYRRADGTVVTGDCSAVRKAARRAKRMLVATMAALVAAVTGGLVMQGCATATTGEVMPPTTTQPAAPANMQGK